MCTLLWLYLKLNNIGLRNWEVLLMIYFDFLYYLAFKVVRRMGRELDDEERKQNKDS